MNVNILMIIFQFWEVYLYWLCNYEYLPSEEGVLENETRFGLHNDICNYVIV